MTYHNLDLMMTEIFLVKYQYLGYASNYANKSNDSFQSTRSGNDLINKPVG